MNLRYFMEQHDMFLRKIECKLTDGKIAIWRQAVRDATAETRLPYTALRSAFVH